jgi:hypothetical protein
MKKIGLWSFVLSLVFISYGNALGSLCMVQPNSNERIFRQMVVAEFNKSALVFSGKVVAAEFVPVIKKGKTGREIQAKTLIYRFSVDKLWKGDGQSEVILYTDVDKFGDILRTTSEDFNFKVNKHYLVFASGLEHNWKANTCGRTGFLRNAEYDIQVLQELTENGI